MEWLLSLLLGTLLSLATVTCFQQKVKVTSACSEVDTNVTNYVTKDKSYRIIWTGDFPFSDRHFCKLTFKRAVNEAICIDTIMFNMTSISTYLKYFKNNEAKPFKTYHKNAHPFEICDHYDFVHVEIGGHTMTSLPDGNHVTIKIHKKIHHIDFGPYLGNVFVLVGIAMAAIFCLVLCIVISCKCAHVRRRAKHTARSHSRTPMLEC